MAKKARLLDYRAPAYTPKIYSAAARFARWLLRLMVSKSWTRTGNFPQQGGFIAAGNHVSNFDPVALAYFMYDNKRIPAIMAKSSLFSVPILGWLLRATGQIPVHRSSDPSQAIGQAVRVAEGGRAVVIFPEGTLTSDPNLWPMTGKTGAVRIAIEAGVPLIPVGQWGSEGFLPRTAKFFKFFPRTTLRAKAGEPLDLDDLRAVEGPLDAAALREGTERLMAAITALVEELRGESAPAQRWDPVVERRAKTKSNEAQADAAPSTQDPEEIP